MERLPDASSSGGGAFQTDVRRRTALSTSANALRPLGAAASASDTDEGAGVTSDEYLRAVEEEVNRSIDRDVETLVDGMGEIVALASVRSPLAPAPSQRSDAYDLGSDR